MSNTHKRILSALILLTILYLAVYFGKNSFSALVLIIGLITFDEIYKNFIKRSRCSLWYVFSISSILVPYIAFNYFHPFIEYKFLVAYLGVALNLLLILYLFKVKMASDFLQNSFFKFPFLAALLIGIPLICFSILFEHILWVKMFYILITISVFMDTGAWLFGKKLGKHKLWPSVSPNKTIEGLVGGIISSCLGASVSWWLLIDPPNIILIFTFAFLGALSQVGDLIQSKIKRQYGVKDSSNLIPGHGGFYDRIDSLLFIAPLYSIAIRFLA